MKIDLTVKGNLNAANVAKLLASKNNMEDCQLRVTQDGIAFLSNDVANINLQGLAFRLETWDCGGGCVGYKASKNTAWVQSILACLNNNWPTPKSTYIDTY